MSNNNNNNGYSGLNTPSPIGFHQESDKLPPSYSNFAQPYPTNLSNNYNSPAMNNQDYNQNNNRISSPPPVLPPAIKIQPRNLINAENGAAGAVTGAEAGNNGQWGDMNGLSNKKIRIRFIRKVYLILTTQLLFTFGIVSIFVFVTPVRNFAHTTAGLIVYIISYVLFLALIITFSVCQCFNGLRKVPYNYFLLAAIKILTLPQCNDRALDSKEVLFIIIRIIIKTVSLTYMLGMVSAYHSIQAVLIAIGITFAVTLGVTLFALQTKFDFTNCWLVVICLSFALFGFGIACAITYRYLPILQTVYGGLGACLMALFLAIDTQLLLGNKRYSYSAEDYINAALQLYLDICYLFLYILQAFGSSSK